MSDIKNPLDSLVVMHDANRISVSLEEVKSFFVSEPISLPDGQSVIFHAARDGGMQAFCVKPLDAPLPTRITAAEAFVEPESLVTYLKTFRTEEMIAKASMSRRTVTVILDYHGGSTDATAATVGANTHTAALHCGYDPDFEKWKTLFDKPIPQELFGDVIEDMIHTIAEPSAAELITAVRDIEIDRVSKIKSKINKRDGTTNLVLEEVDTQRTTSYDLPQAVTLAVPIFQGGTAVAIKCYLRYSIDPTGLKFKLVPPGLEKTIRDEFRNIVEGIAGDTGVPIYYTA